MSGDEAAQAVEQETQTRLVLAKARKTRAKTAFTKQRNAMLREATKENSERVEEMLARLETLADEVNQELSIVLELVNEDLPAQQRVIEEMEKAEKEYSETVSFLSDCLRRGLEEKAAIERIHEEAASQRDEEEDDEMTRERREEQERAEQEYRRFELEFRQMEQELEERRQHLGGLARHQQQQQQQPQPPPPTPVEAVTPLTNERSPRERAYSPEEGEGQAGESQSRHATPSGGARGESAQAMGRSHTPTPSSPSAYASNRSPLAGAAGREERKSIALPGQASTPSARHEASGRRPCDEREQRKMQVGQDMWRQLQRVAIPSFTGEKRQYEGWKAAFYSCVDAAPATDSYKLLQLRQSLKGDALRLVENLGHSEFAYRAALERLEREFGGERRRLVLALEGLDNFRPIVSESAQQLKKLADLLDVTVVNLRAAGRESELLSNGLMHIRVQKKLPVETLSRYHRWVSEQAEGDTLSSLHKWLLAEAEFQTVAMEAIKGIEANNTWRRAKVSPTQNSSRAESLRTHFGSPAEKELGKDVRNCRICQGQHGVWKCPKFLSLEVEVRWKKAKEARLCFQCLGVNHPSASCRWTQLCGVNGCKGRHHRLLHQDRREARTARLEEAEVATKTAEMKVGSGQEECTLLSGSGRHIALRTIPVIVSNGSRRLRINALLDDASTVSYLNASVAAELGLRGEPEKMSVRVLNGQVESFKSMSVEVCLQSLDGKVREKVAAFTVEQVTGDLKAVDWSEFSEHWSHLKDVPFEKPVGRRRVDLLIGIDYADLHAAYQEVYGNPGQPIARRTPLGWTCVGRLHEPASESCHSHCSFFCQTCQTDIAESLKRSWGVEEVKEQSAVGQTIEEQRILGATERSLKVIDGHYQVAVPWKTEARRLPCNWEVAKRRLLSTERRLLRDRPLARAYQEVLDQHLKKGYVRKVGEGEPAPSQVWYLPHFAVLRPDKATTKVRIVFDAAAKCQGISLNDAMYAGPKLQNDLLEVLLRFRRGLVALACDIQEMYLRIKICPEDRSMFRFLWRDLQQDQEPAVYEFERVVFGANCSPFLAQLVTQSHAKRYQAQFPLAANAVLRATYMDDSLASVMNKDDGRRLHRELSDLLGKAGMRPHKWMTNSNEVLAAIPEKDRGVQEECLLQAEGTTAKTLGVCWSPKEDTLRVAISTPKLEATIRTKRELLQRVAGIFDPCGFLTPCVIRGKVILQEVWRRGSDWDDKLDADLEAKASRWSSEFGQLQQISVPRCVQPYGEAGERQLHVFVDASQEAYGAVVYLRSQCGDQVEVRFVTAKARVSPLTSHSIPRLELLAATLGAKLGKLTAKTLEMKTDDAVFWSDSANVLWWVRGHSRIFKPFVANRVAQIQELVEPSQWRHIPTKLNPADVASRGCDVSNLTSASSWWTGPEFLERDEVEWPAKLLPELPAREMERRKRQGEPETTMIADRQLSEWRLDPSRFSSFSRLQRTLAWVCRFLLNCQESPEQRERSVDLTLEELNSAEERLIRQEQQGAFAEELARIRFGRELSTASKLSCLRPILDEAGVMRVDGRLKFGRMPYRTRHPIILPRDGWITRLIIKVHHEAEGHGGTNQTLAALSERFWILNAREAIRAGERDCAVCRRRKAVPEQQLMAPLPAARLEGSLRAFSNVAVDYGGPFTTVQGRGRRRQKRYLALFTCLETRAVHLEMAYSLDTDAFLNAFFRMTDRRGTPLQVFSDNGGNFVKGEKELRELEELDHRRLQQKTANRRIQWHFQPPAAPHFGGAHEIMVRAAKRALVAILGESDVTDEELHSAFTGAEALLNSRPLTYQTAHPGDEEPLTPNHFLHGQAGGRFAPDVDKTDVGDPRRRWRRVQELITHVWRRWMREWLPGLQPRKKWTRAKENVRRGDVVLVVQANNPRGSWPLGRVTEVHPGRDGRVRVAEVKVGQITLLRPITRLCVLHSGEETVDDDSNAGDKN